MDVILPSLSMSATCTAHLGAESLKLRNSLFFDHSQELDLQQAPTTIPQQEIILKKIPLPWNSRFGKHFVLKLKRNWFQMLTPHVLCLSTPVLQCLALPGSSTSSSALQEQEPRAAPALAWHSPTAHQQRGQKWALEIGLIQALQ